MRIKYFNLRIKRERLDRSLNQKDFAELCGVSQQTVSRWENTDSPPDRQTLLLVASRLQLNPQWLATGIGDKKPTISAEAQSPYLANPTEAAKGFGELVGQTGFSDQMQSELLSIFSNLTPAGQHEALAMLHRLAQKDQQMRIELTNDQYNSMVRHTGDTQHRGSVAVSSWGKKKKTGKRKPA